MSGGTSINTHLKEMKMLADKLASIGSAISEEDLYNHYCTHLMMQMDTVYSV